MTFADLNEHPKKHSLMATAFTLYEADSNAQKIWKARAEQEAKV